MGKKATSRETPGKTTAQILGDDPGALPASKNTVEAIRDKKDGPSVLAKVVIYETSLSQKITRRAQAKQQTSGEAGPLRPSQGIVILSHGKRRKY